MKYLAILYVTFGILGQAYAEVGAFDPAQRAERRAELTLDVTYDSRDEGRIEE